MNAHVRPPLKAPLSLTVNGRSVEAEVEPRTHLADFLREELDLTGTHLGCEHGVCGACTLLVDGEPARGCITFAATCGDAEIVTIEGLDDDELTAELRAAFNREHALQCGFCTPGMLIAARDLALRLPEPDERRIRIGLAGNLCRCTGYAGIVRAIRSVIAERRDRGIAATVSERPLGPVGAHRPGASPRSAPDRREAASASGIPASAATSVREFTPAETFEQRFSVAFPPERVFALFGHVKEVAVCLPGAFVEATPSPERVEGGIRVKVGPISAAFRGVANIERDEATRRGRILGAGADGRSAAQGEVRYEVRPGSEPETSDVVLTVGYTLKGPLAQFGRPGLVRDVAARLTAEFARNLETRLSGRAVEAEPSAPSGLNPFRLVAGLILGRLTGWLNRIRSR
ncbi:xanthine dehydrogenase family Fe-S subunit [Hansschlegelia zhihuaiae]|uniref:2Fe-2S iron-sulfur cluster binding domain-containing protein n=1 Tax=Hansschlegelia zhihuaiae TaxID=405005 RepID=A0A4Q0MIQ9_9HYPH|nr:2Fe-2S iron-sulfur cluster-binding protein [Hansschlegelia zhihuaiae]RXF72826.1 2Fe-2S iron-sulfur cluster binding domain-containing protein [Hansschlegelia zhihuaiae]